MGKALISCVWRPLLDTCVNWPSSCFLRLPAQVMYLLGVCGLRGDELQLDVVVETQADSDLLLDAERLQAEEAAAARGALQEVQVERLRQSCHTHTQKRQTLCSDWLLHSEVWKQVKSELTGDRVSSVRETTSSKTINCKPVTVWSTWWK